MTFPRALKTIAIVSLAATVLVAIDGLLLKYDHPTGDLVRPALFVIGFLALLLRAMARRVPEHQRSRLDRMWTSLDGTGLVWLLFVLVLLAVFHGAFQRASGDGRDYFVQLRSAVIDRDLDLSNEVKEFGASNPVIFPFGSAMLWLPFYLFAHLWLGVLNVAGETLRRDGYFYPYQMAIGLGTLAYGVAGLMLIWRITSDYFERRLALAITLIVTLASFIVWYLAIDNSYTHGNSLFVVTLFLYVWHRTRTVRSPRAWGALGLSGGLMVMVRWQNAVFLAPLFADFTRLAWRAVRERDRTLMREAIRGQALASAGLIAGFLPQMYFWNATGDGWFSMPHGQAGQQWWSDALMLDVLFSSNHGLLAWHPVLYLSLLGVPLFFRRDPYLALLLTGLFFAQVYINGAVATWWGGSAFGGRRFDGCALFFVLGLTALVRWCLDRPAAVLTAVFGVFATINVFLMRDVTLGRLPMGEGIPIGRILGATTERLGNPFSFPANALFAWRMGDSPAAYDRLGTTLFNNVEVDLGDTGDDRFLGGGWSGAERNPDTSFRWAVSRESAIAVPLMGPRYLQPGEAQRLSDYVLRARLTPFAFPGSPPQNVTVEVNGRDVTTWLVQPGFHEYEVDIPSDHLHRNLNVIRFRYAYARSPREVGVGDDERALAVCFDYIHVLQRFDQP